MDFFALIVAAVGDKLTILGLLEKNLPTRLVEPVNCLCESGKSVD